MKTDVILLCGGNSTRFGKDKLHQKIDGIDLIKKTFSAFYPLDEINNIIVVKRSDDDKIISLLSSEKTIFVNGGKTRFESTLNGLKASKSEIVLIHDGARSFVSKEIILNTISSVDKYGTGVVAIKCTDTIRQSDGEVFGDFIDRNTLYRMQTPQGFLRSEILDAYEKAYVEFGINNVFTDDSSVYSHYYDNCRVVLGSEENIKITYQSDIKQFKTGIGYDIHRLSNEDKGFIPLCGVKIPYNKSFIAHSDGDVPIHALCDSLLSSIGEKDIGHFFPDTDPKYKDISSLELLDIVVSLVKDKGYSINNVSISIICERPKLSPYIDEMKNSLSKHLFIEPNEIGITVTTNEKTSLVGSEDAIASFATSSII